MKTRRTLDGMDEGLPVVVVVIIPRRMSIEEASGDEGDGDEDQEVHHARKPRCCEVRCEPQPLVETVPTQVGRNGDAKNDRRPRCDGMKQPRQTKDQNRVSEGPFLQMRRFGEGQRPRRDEMVQVDRRRHDSR